MKYFIIFSLILFSLSACTDSKPVPVRTYTVQVTFYNGDVDTLQTHGEPYLSSDGTVYGLDPNTISNSPVATYVRLIRVLN